MSDEYKVYDTKGKLLHKGTVDRETAAKLFNEERNRTRGEGTKPSMVRVGEGDSPGPSESDE